MTRVALEKFPRGFRPNFNRWRKPVVSAPEGMPDFGNYSLFVSSGSGFPSRNASATNASSFGRGRASPMMRSHAASSACWHQKRAKSTTSCAFSSGNAPMSSTNSLAAAVMLQNQAAGPETASASIYFPLAMNKNISYAVNAASQSFHTGS
jgi:hypothetical protein